jgi:hypothetical protein
VFDKDSAEAAELLAMLRPHYQEALALAEEEYNKLPVGTRKKLGGVNPNDLYTVLYDKETEEETGEIAFKFTMKASGKYRDGHAKAGQRWQRRPMIFDAKGKPMDKAPNIWGGTVGRIRFEVSPYFIPGTGAAGLKLSLMGVQVIKLVSNGAQTADEMGFEEEDGYEYEAPATIDTLASAEGDTDDADTGNF